MAAQRNTCPIDLMKNLLAETEIRRNPA